jgi:hypothetical protein
MGERDMDVLEHAKQLDAVRWMPAVDLAARWGVSVKTVRKIPRDALPYLTLGASDVRRYDPRDVEAYELANKRGTAA